MINPFYHWFGSLDDAWPSVSFRLWINFTNKIRRVFAISVPWTKLQTVSSLASLSWYQVLFENDDEDDERRDREIIRERERRQRREKWEKWMQMVTRRSPGENFATWVIGYSKRDKRERSTNKPQRFGRQNSRREKWGSTLPSTYGSMFRTPPLPTESEPEAWTNSGKIFRGLKRVVSLHRRKKEGSLTKILKEMTFWSGQSAQQICFLRVFPLGFLVVHFLSVLVFVISNPTFFRSGGRHREMPLRWEPCDAFDAELEPSGKKGGK